MMASNHGFVRAADGTITVFDPPGSVETEVLGIGGGGAITGYYSDGTAWHGFVRHPAGAIITFDVTGDINGTYPGSIESGAITGYFADGNSVDHGFVRTR
jgi:hypothetical protein